MIQDAKRSIAYLCPHCRQSIVVERDLFSLAASPTRIPCPCGRSELEIEFLPQRVRLRVPCLFCGREHQVTCSSHAFIKEKAMAFSCAMSGMDCCYVGEEAPVYAATRRLEQTVDKLYEEEERGAFLDELVMHEVLSELREIAGRNGISCACGSRRYAITVRGGAVDLVCQDCGGKLRIGAATDEDLDQLCCRYTLTIPGRPAADRGSGAKP